MEHIAALMLIIGCADGLRECQELPAPTPIYETFEECESERLPAAHDLRGHARHIMATCVHVDPALEYADATLEWDIDVDGRLVVSIEPSSSYMLALRDDRKASSPGE